MIVEFRHPVLGPSTPPHPTGLDYDVGEAWWSLTWVFQVKAEVLLLDD